MTRRVDPEVAAVDMRAAGLTPLVPYPGSNKAFWLCRCDSCQREVTPKYNKIQQGRGGCVHCGRARGGLNRRVPEVVAIAEMRSAGVEPLGPYPGADVPWSCQCQRCGRHVTPTLHNRRSGQGSCAYCARRKVDPEIAVAAMLASGAQPQDPFRTSDAQWKCLCVSCNRSITPTYSAVLAGQSPCKYCSGRAVDVEDAVLIMRRSGVDPQIPWPGADKPWPSKCLTCRRAVTPIYNNVRRQHRGCGFCAGQVVDPTAAAEIMLAANLEPLEPFPGSSKPWLCRCGGCDGEVRPRYAGVRIGIGGCRRCARFGFDPNNPSAVYLVVNERWHAAKIGVMGRKSDRLSDHRRHGWTAYIWRAQPAIWHFDLGTDALAAEKAVLEWWRGDLGAPPALLNADMPQRGASETAALALVDLDATAEIVETVLRG